MAKLHFFYSTMNAGKSTALLQSNHNYLESDLNTVLFIAPTTSLLCLDCNSQEDFIDSCI